MELERDDMMAGRHFDAAEQHIRVEDRLHLAVDLGPPARIKQIVQHEQARLVGIDLDDASIRN